MKTKKQRLRSKSVKTLKRKLDDLFSLFVRLRDKGICYTCGIQKDPKDMDAGHYIKRQHNSLRFDERNVHAQCKKCNRFMGGNMSEYAVRLQRDYGQGILEEFSAKKQQIKVFTTTELEGLITHYKNEIWEIIKQISK